MDQRLHGSEIPESVLVEHFEEPKHPQASREEADHGTGGDMTSFAEQAPYAQRLRMILFLSLICWAALIAGALAVID